MRNIILYQELDCRCDENDAILLGVDEEKDSIGAVQSLTEPVKDLGHQREIGGPKVLARYQARIAQQTHFVDEVCIFL